MINSESQILLKQSSLKWNTLFRLSKALEMKPSELIEKVQGRVTNG
jgi:DNA-binding Xre family transcriptional regulator